MSSGESSPQGWQSAKSRLAVLIIIAAQALGLGTGRSQDAVQPRLDEEMAKQEKIYRSQGAEVPSGYITNRALSDYLSVLPAGFCEALAKLGSSDRWLDIGAGDGQAILDYYASEADGTPVSKCARPGARARAVAMSIEDRRTANWQLHVANFRDDRIRYLYGKRLREYSREQLGKFQIVTDVFGGFSYTEDLSRFLDTVLGSLEIGGAFYTLVQGVHLENGKDKPDTWYLTELADTAGRRVKVCTWLKQSPCVKVDCESKSEWDAPTELIKIQKVCSDVAIPRVKLLKYEAGNPPSRQFQLEP